MKTSLFIFATTNTFQTIPPVKQLFNYLKGVNIVQPIQSVINGYEDFFPGSEETLVINNYQTYKQYNSQTFIQKIKKYFKLITSLIHLLFKNSKENKRIFIYSPEIFVIWLSTFLFFKNIKVIYHQFEMVIPGDLSKLDKYFLKRVIENIDKIDLLIFPEENRKNYFQSLLPKYREDQFFILPNSNNNIFDFSSKKCGKKIRITHIGSVGGNHHLQSFLQAVENLPEEKFEVWFVGLLTGDALKIIENSKLKNVYLRGQVQHEDLKEIYLKTDIGVILYKDNSLHNRFCAPNKLYEYWSYGIPVIGDKLPGLLTVFTEKTLGNLVDMNNPNEILEAFLKMENLDSNRTIKIQKIYNSRFRLNIYLGELQAILEN